MANEKKIGRKLKETQKEHAKALKKLEKTRTKLDGRGKKLRVLEAKLAELEGTLHETSSQGPDGNGASAISLRPARLIVNPKSGCIRDGTHPVSDLVERLRSHGIEAQVTLKTSGKVVRESARDAVKRGEKLVIVAGGDGTIEKVAAQLVGSETTLGVLPVGTMNNLARSLGVPLDVEDACALIGMGTARKIDVGCVNVKAKKHVKYFLETAGLGLGAIAFPMGQDVKKGLWGGLPEALRKIVAFKPSPITVELDDGQVIQANSQVVTVSNAPLTGMNFLIAPEAKMDDGWLDVAIYDELGKTDLLAYLWAARNGQRPDNPKVKRYRSRYVHIVPNDVTPVVSDKDPLPERGELDIQVLSQALSVIVGKGIGLSFPVDVAPSVPPLSGPQKTNGHSEKIEASAPEMSPPAEKEMAHAA